MCLRIDLVLTACETVRKRGMEASRRQWQTFKVVSMYRCRQGKSPHHFTNSFLTLPRFLMSCLFVTSSLIQPLRRTIRYVETLVLVEHGENDKELICSDECGHISGVLEDPWNDESGRILSSCRLRRALRPLRMKQMYEATSHPAPGITIFSPFHGIFFSLPRCRGAYDLFHLSLVDIYESVSLLQGFIGMAQIGTSLPVHRL